MSAEQIYAPIVELQQVYKSFPVPGTREVRHALEDINLVIGDIPGRGQCRVMLGPSGCGKSTILNIIAGLVKPSQGKALLQGQPITGPGRDRGMVFPELQLVSVAQGAGQRALRSGPGRGAA